MADRNLIACPICGGGDSRLHCTKESFGGMWEVRRCAECGHGFVANPPTLDRLNEIQSNLDAHTGGSAERLLPPSADPENVFLAHRIASLTPARGRTLDVGSGGGSSTYCVHRAGFIGPHLLIDFDPRAAFAVEQIPNSRFEQRAFESLTADGGKFDVIIMSHVLEHSLAPLEWLSHAATLLSPDGVLAIAIPNFGGVYRFLGERDPWIIPPVHLQFFTPGSMRRAMEKSGLRLLKMASRSYVTLDPVDRRLSLKSRVVRHGWNALAFALNQTARGIVLHAYATPDAATAMDDMHKRRL